MGINRNELKEGFFRTYIVNGGIAAANMVTLSNGNLGMEISDWFPAGYYYYTSGNSSVPVILGSETLTSTGFSRIVLNNPATKISFDLQSVTKWNQSGDPISGIASANQNLPQMQAGSGVLAASGVNSSPLTVTYYSNNFNLTWTSSTGAGAASGAVEGGVFRAGNYFYVSNSAGTFRSSDGITYTGFAPLVGGAGRPRFGYSPTYGYICIGSTGGLSTSGDGVTWTSRGLKAQLNTSIQTIAGLPGQPVLAGGSGVIQYSTDAVNWTSQASPIGNVLIKKIVAANGMYLAMGESANVATSTNGTTWTVRTTVPPSGATHYWTDGTYGGTSTPWMICGYHGSSVPSQTGNIALNASTDGITWTTRRVLFTSAPTWMYNIAWVSGGSFGNGTFVLYGGPNFLYWSTTGFASSSAANQFSIIGGDSVKTIP